MLRQVAALAVVTVFATVASAQIGLTITQRAGAPAGFVTNVLTVDSVLDITNFSIVVEGGQHTFFDHVGALGDSDLNRQPAIIIGLDPGYDFDSYVTFGGTPASAAANFGATGHPRFGDPTDISSNDFIMSAFNTAGGDTGSFEVAQITIGDTANGNLFYSIFAGSSASITARELVTNGVIGFVIPVPGAVWLGGALLSSMGLFRYLRRRKA